MSEARAAGAATALANFRDRLLEERGAVAASSDGAELCFELGSRAVHVSIADAELAELVLDTLSAPRVGPCRAPDVRIEVWTKSACGGSALPVPWPAAAIGPGGLVDGSDAGGLVAVHETFTDAVTLVDVPAQTALYRVPDRASLAWWERASPLRMALAWLFSGAGLHLGHAGAVADERRTVLLVGPPGSGKTTAVRAGLAHGMSLVADDYLLLDADRLTAHALYRTLCVRVKPGAEARRLVRADRVAPGSREVAAVVVPRIAGGRARLRSCGPAEALAAWAPTTLVRMPSVKLGAMGALSQVVRRVPCYALDLGDDPAELARALAAALAGRPA